VTSLEEDRDEPATDVPAGTGDEHPHGPQPIVRAVAVVASRRSDMTKVYIPRIDARLAKP